MKEIIKELLQKSDYEMYQIGLTPRTAFTGTQEDHDRHHLEMAEKYKEAARLLSGKYCIIDWMVSEIHDFKTLEEAKLKFNELIEESKNQQCNCDIQLISIIGEFNNVD